MKARLQSQIGHSIIIIIFVVIFVVKSPLNITTALTRIPHADWNGIASYAVYFPLFHETITVQGYRLIHISMIKWFHLSLNKRTIFE